MGQIWVLSRFQSQTIGNHYTPPNARYNAQIRSIGRIFCLPCLFGCGECPKPCHARIFWQGVNRPHLGADFHKLIGLIWIGQIDILGVILYHEITPWLWLRTKHFQSITVFIFCQSKTACINGSRTKKPLFKSAIYHLMYKYKKTPQNHPHFWPKKPLFLPKFCTAKILHFALIFHADFSSHGNRIFWRFGERHATITQLFDPLNHIVTKSPNVVTTETVVTTFPNGAKWDWGNRPKTPVIIFITY